MNYPQIKGLFGSHYTTMWQLESNVKKSSRDGFTGRIIQTGKGSGEDHTRNRDRAYHKINEF
jgi:hypothetical protein